MTARVLIDTSAIVALWDQSELHHQACVETHDSLQPPLLTCLPVITEAAYLLGKVNPQLIGRLLEALSHGLYQVLPIDHRDFAPINEILKKYADQRFDLADACLMHLSEREGIQHVFTLDNKDFHVFRTSKGGPLSVLPGTGG